MMHLSNICVRMHQEHSNTYNRVQHQAADGCLSVLLGHTLNAYAPMGVEVQAMHISLPQHGMSAANRIAEHHPHIKREKSGRQANIGAI